MVTETKIKFRPYQQPLYDDIMEALQTHKKVLAQAETGWGKSILIGALANRLPGRTLIMTHRIELLNQNHDWIDDCGVLTAKIRTPQLLKMRKSVICMAQTLAARFKKYGSDYIGDFDNVIIDEVHMDFFKKCYDQLEFERLIAVTATPLINKKEEKVVDGQAYVRKLSMADEYDCIVQGVSTQELIDLGYLTQDFNIQLTPPNLKNLVSSNASPDGYTSKSLTNVFGSSASIDTVLKGYQKYCIGKKTMIFNPTTAVNKKMYDVFQDLGINCKMFDSVNKVPGQTRQEVVDWFKSQDDAVLLNVGVFTTGFSVNDLECIIYNKKTKSLTLWLQSIGRGGRVLNSEQKAAGKIKDKFLVLDCGLNIAEHGRWSETRDWSRYFVVHPWKLKKEMDVLNIWECKQCGAYNVIGEKLDPITGKIVCPECGAPKPKQKEGKKINGDFVVMEKPVYPQPNKILEYVQKQGGDSSMAFKLVRTQIIDLFKYHTTREDFIARKHRYIARVGEIFRPCYFAIIKSNLKGKNRRLSTEIDSIIKTIKNHYHVD